MTPPAIERMQFMPFYAFLVLGVLLLVLELVVFQFAVFWLFFVGIGALLAALCAWLFSSTGFALPLAVFVLGSAATALLFYRPLRRWRSQPSAMPDSDVIGQRVRIVQPLSPGVDGSVQWSGSEWPARLAPDQPASLPADSFARVAAVQGIRLIVAADAPRPPQGETTG